MSSTNADSMTNAQGEFAPKVPPSEPLTTKGHQVGQQASPNDKIPEFQAKVLPAGSAPPGRTFQPNPTSEVPGQADNPNVQSSSDKEGTYTSAQSTITGSDSAQVHTGIGKPIQGQSSNETRHTTERGTAGLEGVGAQGGSGLREESGYESNAAKRLQEDHTSTGPKSGQEHNTSLTGAEGKEGVTAEALAGERA